MSKKRSPKRVAAPREPLAEPRPWWRAGEQRSAAWTLTALVVLAGAIWAVYGRAVNTPFIFDDKQSIVENYSIRTLWPLVGSDGQPGPLSPPVNIATSGRPLVNLSLAVNYRFGGLNPLGYHVLNICLHVLVALVVFAVIRRVLRLPYFGGRFDRAAEPLALAVALLWALHPLATESVTYVTQRTELMVGLFYLTTVYCSLRYWAAATRGGRMAWLSMAVLGSAAGMASKEMMVTAPVAVLLLERTLLAGSFREAWRRSWPLYAGLAATWLLLLALNYNSPRGDTAGFNLDVPAYAWWFTQAKVLLMYLKLAVWPWPLSVHYGMPYLDTLGAAGPWLLAVALLVAGILSLLWRNHPVGLVGTWVLLVLSPTLIVPIATEVVAERRLYLPLVALVSLAVVGGYWLVGQMAAKCRPEQDRAVVGRRLLAVAGGVALVLVLVAGVASARRLAVYRDELTLWQDAVAAQPEDPMACNNLGAELAKRGRNQEAMQYYRRAIELRPGYVKAECNIAGGLALVGHTQEAIDHLQKGLQLKPDSAVLLTNLGALLADAGENDQAIACHEKALQIKPHYAEAQFNLACVLARVGRTEQAVEHYRQALRIRPGYADAEYNLGIVLRDAGQTREAIEHFRRAVQERPDFADAHTNLGILLATVGSVPEAIAELQTTLKLAPDDWRSHANLAGVLRHAGRFQEAAQHLQQSLRINPNNIRAYYDLARLYAQMDQQAKAISTAESAVKLARSGGQTELAQKIEAWLTDYRAGPGDRRDGAPKSNDGQPSP